MAISLNKEKLKTEECEKLKEVSGTNVYSCYQCGNCTAGCPCVDAMDIPPHEVIRLAQFGQVKKLLEANTMWICASCVTCSVRCPRSVDISGVMEALRQIALQNGNEDITKLEELSSEQLEELPQIAVISNFRKLTS